MKVIKPLFFIFLMIAANQTFSQGGFLSSVQMVGGGTSSNIRPRVSLNAFNHPVVTWNKASNKAIYFSAWNGTSFNAPSTLTPSGLQADVFNWAGQEIASIKDTVYIVYASLIGTESNVFIQKSINGGTSFSDTLRVSNIGTDKARFPSVGINGNGQPVVTFMHMLSNWSLPYYAVANSTNGGASFMPDVDATTALTGNEVCDCCPASIVCKDNQQAVLFRDNATNQRDIKAVMSFNNGSTFDSIRKVDLNNWVLNACPSTGPDGQFGSDSLYTVFSSGATTPMQAFISATHASNMQLGSHRVISPANEIQQFPKLAGNKDTIGIVWQQNNKAMFVYSTNGITGLSSVLKINDSLDLATNPDIAYANGTFHIVWQSNSGMVHYKYFDVNGGTGVQEFETNEIGVSPNPSTYSWFVDIHSQPEITYLDLFSMDGKILYSKSFPAHTPIQSVIMNNSFVPGNYFLNVHSGAKASTVKLVKW